MFSHGRMELYRFAARLAKRENGGNGGGSPRKYDDLLTVPSDVAIAQSTYTLYNRHDLVERVIA
jgi:hypothetical protein